MSATNLQEEESSPQLHAEKLYIVYGYNNYISSYPTKYIYGIYYNITDTINRINRLCENIGFNESFGTYYSNDGCMTYFVNVLPIGEQYTELFTT